MLIIMRTPELTAIAVMGLVVCACGDKSANVVGKWKLNLPATFGTMISTGVNFGADHTLSGAYQGTWSIAGDVVSLKLTSMGGMSIDAMKGAIASQPNGAAAAKLFDNLQLKIDASGKDLYATDGKGKTSPAPMLTRDGT